MKKRLFLAIPLSDSLLQKFEGLKDRYGLEYDVRWTPKQNLHVTVYFFGDVDEKDIPAMDEKLKEVALSTPRIDLAFEKILYAPPNRPPRMVWAEFASNAAYTALVRKVYDAVKTFLEPQSVQQPGREPIPHITLARFQNPAVAKTLHLEPIPPEKMTVTSCELIESELTPKGSIYTILEKYAFT